MNDKLKEALKGADYKKPNSKGVAVWVLVILFIVFFFFIVPPFEESEPTKKTVNTQRVTDPNLRYPDWGVPFGSEIPVGVWSKTFKIQPGCSTRYDGGNGTYYKIRRRLYSNKWEAQVPNQTGSANQIQFMALKEGITEISFSYTCKR